MQPGKVKKECDEFMFAGQYEMQVTFLFVSLSCVPVLLLGKPLYHHFRGPRRRRRFVSVTNFRAPRENVCLLPSFFDIFPLLMLSGWKKTGRISSIRIAQSRVQSRPVRQITGIKKWNWKLQWNYDTPIDSHDWVYSEHRLSHGFLPQIVGFVTCSFPWVSVSNYDSKTLRDSQFDYLPFQNYPTFSGAKFSTKDSPTIRTRAFRYFLPPSEHGPSSRLPSSSWWKVYPPSYTLSVCTGRLFSHFIRLVCTSPIPLTLRVVCIFQGRIHE